MHLPCPLTFVLLSDLETVLEGVFDEPDLPKDLLIRDLHVANTDLRAVSSDCSLYYLKRF